MKGRRHASLLLYRNGQMTPGIGASNSRYCIASTPAIFPAAVLAYVSLSRFNMPITSAERPAPYRPHELLLARHEAVIRVASIAIAACYDVGGACGDIGGVKISYKISASGHLVTPKAARF